MSGLWRIFRVARSQWHWLAGGILLGVLVVAANALLMALSGWFIASMAVAGVTGASFNYFFPAAAIRALAIARTVGRYGERLVTHEAAFRALAEIRVWLFTRLEPLAPAGLERYAGGEVAGRLRADVDALEQLYLRIVAPVATGGVTALLAWLFVSIWSAPAALVLLVLLGIAGGGLPLLARRLAAEPGRRSAALAGDLRSAVTEGVQGMEELILLGAAERQAERIDSLSARLVAEQERLAGISGLTMAGSITSGGLAMAGVLWVGTASNGLAGPDLVMLILFSVAAFEAVGQLPGALQALPATRESVRRILELIDTRPAVPEPLQPAPLPSGAGIELQGVTCRYDGGRPVVECFDLRVAERERVALTGPSGVGKSTLAEILSRFRAYEGSVRVGGQELRDLAGADLARLMAVLPQRPHLFNTSIRENILLGNPDAGDEALTQALADAGLTAWVARLPQGLDTRVGEGGSAVSGGEARRIALARALLVQRPILLLDEPTEGLDAATEQEVVARLRERTRGQTVLVITHRPACLALADRVVRLEASRIRLNQI